MKLQEVHLSKLGDFYGNEVDALYKNEYLYNEEDNSISFLFKTSDDCFYIKKTIDEVNESIIENILTKEEIQKIGNLLSQEEQALYMYYENNLFVFEKNQRKLSLEKTNKEILDLLYDYKDIEIIPRLTIKKSRIHKDAYLIGGTRERRKYHYFIKDYIETSNNYIVPCLFYAEGIKKWIETKSYFDKDEFNTILSKKKVC